MAVTAVPTSADSVTRWGDRPSVEVDEQQVGVLVGAVRHPHRLGRLGAEVGLRRPGVRRRAVEHAVRKQRAAYGSCMPSMPRPYSS